MSEIKDNIVQFNPEYSKVGTANIVKFPEKKHKLTKETMKFIGKIAVVSLAVGTAFTVFKGNGKTVIIPEDKVIYEADYTVTGNDNITKIVNKFYDQEKGIESKEQFKAAIKEENPDGFRAGYTIKVPNIIDKNNPLYIKLMEIEEALKKLEYDGYEEYDVETKEDFYGIAEKIVYDESQINECIYMIKKANDLDKILPTRKILVPKASYFELQYLRNQLKSQLDNSLNNTYVEEDSVEHHY